MDRPYRILYWMNLRQEPKKSSNVMNDQILQAINALFMKFFSAYSWILYSIVIFFLILGLIYVLIDERRHRNFIERKHRIQRSRERPLQKRRPGAQARNHEIYRSVMKKVNEYMEPEERTCVFRKTRSGTIYGQVGKVHEFNPRDEIEESVPASTELIIDNE